MTVKITKSYIQIERMVINRKEIGLIYGALSSVIECKEKEIYFYECGFKVKNEKYEVLVGMTEEWELKKWQKILPILQLFSLYPIPNFPMHKILEIRVQGESKYVKWKCECGLEYERNYFIWNEERKKYLCPKCQSSDELK